MKKLTATIFVALLTAVSTGAAKADIASSGYVDEKVEAVTTALEKKAEKSAVDTLSQTVSTNTGNITILQSQMAGKANSADVYTTTAADGKFQVKTNLVPSTGYEAAKGDDTKYPSVKAVDQAIIEATQGIASESEVQDLQNKVGTATLETTAQDLSAAVNELNTDVTDLESEVATKQNANMGAEAANKIVTTDGTGNITTSDTIANTQVSGLGALANKDTVSAADIDANAVTTEKIVDANVTRAKLATDVTTSLDKADTALQQASLAGYVTKKQADSAYAAKSTETTASTASTNAQQALTDIGTKANLTTTAKDNLVNAINEVDAALDTKADTTAISDMLTKNEAASTYETQENAEATYETKTNAALKYIPKPGVNCTEAGAKCVLVTNGTDFTWEDIARGTSEAGGQQ